MLMVRVIVPKEWSGHGGWRLKPHLKEGGGQEDEPVADFQ